MPDKKFILRDLIHEDYAQLPSLLKSVWKIKTGEDYWIWKYESPPFQTNAWVIEAENGAIVAFTGYWRRPAQMGGITTKPFLVVDIMADPEYRGGKVYSLISRQILEIAKRETVFGFTNPISHRLFKNLLSDYIKIDADVPVFVSLLDGGYAVRSDIFIKSIIGNLTRFFHKMRLKIPGYKDILVQKTDAVEDDFDSLWEDVGYEYGFILYRGKDYLRWRYISSNTVKYQIWKALEKGRLVGYLVTAIRNESHGKKAFLMDWLVSRKRNDVFNAMFKTALSWLLNQKVSMMETWLLGHEKKRAKILRSHFFIRSRRTYSFLLVGHDAAKASRPLSAQEIFLTLGDSDYLATRDG